MQTLQENNKFRREYCSTGCKTNQTDDIPGLESM